MRKINETEREPQRPIGALCCLRLLIAAGVLGCTIAYAEPRGVVAAGAPPPPAANGVQKPAHQWPGRLSKFEARRIRHTCRDHANEKGLKGAERDAFMSKCYFGRVAYRGLRRECAQQPGAKGLDKTSLREFVRECVKERQHQKD